MTGSAAGSQTATAQIPPYLEGAIKENLTRGSNAASIGYTPYFGADVAAMTPQQQAAIGSNNQAADAFGLQTADPTQGLPQAQDYGGMQAYSSAPLYQGAVDQLQQNNPSQYNAIEGMFNGGGTNYGGSNFGSAIGSGSGGGSNGILGSGISGGDLLGVGLTGLALNNLTGGAVGRGLGSAGSYIGNALGLTGGAAGGVAAGSAATAAAGGAGQLTAAGALTPTAVTTSAIPTAGGGTSATGMTASIKAALAANPSLAMLGPAAIAAYAMANFPSGAETHRNLTKQMWDQRLADVGGLAAIEANDPTPQGMTRMEYNLFKNPNKYATKSLTDDELQEQYFQGGLL